MAAGHKCTRLSLKKQKPSPRRLAMNLKDENYYQLRGENIKRGEKMSSGGKGGGAVNKKI